MVVNPILQDTFFYNLSPAPPGKEGRQQAPVPELQDINSLPITLIFIHSTRPKLQPASSNNSTHLNGHG